MAWRRPGDKPLSEPMMVVLPTHMCVTRPQWDKGGVTTDWCFLSLVLAQAFAIVNAPITVTPCLTWEGKSDIDGLVQERRNSIANSQLRLSFTNPSMLSIEEQPVSLHSRVEEHFGN